MQQGGPWDDPTPRLYNVQNIWNRVLYDRKAAAVTAFAADERSISPFLFDFFLGNDVQSYEMK